MDSVQQSPNRAYLQERQAIAICLVSEAGERHPVDDKLDTTTGQVELGQSVTMCRGQVLYLGRSEANKFVPFDEETRPAKSAQTIYLLL